MGTSVDASEHGDRSATRETDATTRVTPWPLVGRDAELRLGHTCIAAGRGTLVVGPAGVGKTRLARTWADDLDRLRRIVRVAPAAMSIPVSAIAAAAADDDDPPVLVIDDAHQLDDDAAALVLRLVIQREIVLVATVRSGEAMPTPLTTLWKDDYVERIDLGELSRREIDEILDTVLDGPIDSATRRHLWDATQGSPLMLRELVRSALADGDLVHTDGLWRLERAPHSVRLDELITARLTQLDGESRRVVDLVALGEPVAFDALTTLAGLDAVAEAEASGLVEAVIDRRRREVRSTHPVCSDVARRAMSAATTVRRYAELAELLDATPLRRRDDIVRSVTWQLQAGGEVISSDMVLAARRALYDHEEQLAIDLAERAGGAEAGMILGVAFADRGEHARAEEVLSEIGDDAPSAERTLIVLQRADALFWGLGRGDDAEALLADAEQANDPGPWKDALTAARAVMASNRGRVREALELSEPLFTAEPAGRAFVSASVAGVASLALAGRGHEARGLAAQAALAREALGDQLALAEPGLFVILGTMAAHHLGQLDDAEATIQLAYDVTTAQGRREGQAWSALGLGDIALTRGTLGTAAARFAEAAGVFASLHQRGPRRWALAGSVLAAAWAGDDARVIAAAGDLAAVPEHPAVMLDPEVRRAEAWACAAQGDQQAALDRLLAAADVATDSGALVLAGAALHDVIRLGGRVEAERWEPIRACDGRLAAARAAFGVAVSTEDPVAALDASTAFADVGADLFAAEAALQATELFEQRGESRAATRSRRAAADAQARTGEEWFVTLDRNTAPSPLTDRERDVAERAAVGMTSREIAEALALSTRTVDNHLQRVYMKLGVSGRRELARALV